VVRRLRLRSPPAGVRVEDFGIRALHLAYELLEPYDTVVLVDAMARGEAPGTVSVLEPDVARLGEDEVPDAHGLNPAAVLRIARELGADVGRVRIVGCEPENLDERIGLSPSVARAVDDAVRIVHQLLAQEVCHEATP
jgi:hydrogenase maturation protease